MGAVSGENESTSGELELSAAPSSLGEPAVAETLELAAALSEAWPYAHKLEFYADRYGSDLSNIKRWLKRGRKAVGAPDLPPFDHAQGMITWWARQMKHRVPAKILSAAAAEEAEAKKQSALDREQITSTERGTGAASVAEDSASVEVRGIPEEVDRGSTIFRLREAEREAGAAYVAATQALATYGDALKKAVTVDQQEAAEKLRVTEGEVELRRRGWESLARTLRLAEQTESKMAKERGDLVEKSVVARFVRDFHAGQVVAFRDFLSRTWPKFSNKSAAEAKTVWEAESEAFLATFQNEFRLT